MLLTVCFNRPVFLTISSIVLPLIGNLRVTTSALVATSVFRAIFVQKSQELMIEKRQYEEEKTGRERQ